MEQVADPEYRFWCILDMQLPIPKPDEHTVKKNFTQKHTP
jgi:hypothetical protein